MDVAAAVFLFILQSPAFPCSPFQTAANPVTGQKPPSLFFFGGGTRSLPVLFSPLPCLPSPHTSTAGYAQGRSALSLQSTATPSSPMPLIPPLPALSPHLRSPPRWFCPVPLPSTAPPPTYTHTALSPTPAHTALSPPSPRRHSPLPCPSPRTHSPLSPAPPLSPHLHSRRRWCCPWSVSSARWGRASRSRRRRPAGRSRTRSRRTAAARGRRAVLPRTACLQRVARSRGDNIRVPAPGHTKCVRCVSLKADAHSTQR